jgi:hypothetical protein
MSFSVKKRIGLLSFFLFFVGMPFAFASSWEIVSKSYYGSGQANSYSKYSQIFGNQISADGRYVVFHSFASNLVPGDFNGQTDIFVRDRVANTTILASKNNSGTPGDSGSLAPSISADGRYVTFSSAASNLVPADTNGSPDIFVFDRVAQTIQRVSVDNGGVEGNDGSSNAMISGNGNFIVFWSNASNLVPNDNNGVSDIFVHDRLAGTVERVSVDNSGNEGDSASQYPTISFDGRYVAFHSFATNFASGGNGANAFVYDRQTNTIERVSENNAGNPGNISSRFPIISDSGRYVTFESFASDLVPSDTNGSPDTFVYDRQTNTIEMISVDDAGNQGNGFSENPSISSDGKYVTFWSNSTNLVPGDTNGLDDFFLHNRANDTTIRIASGTRYGSVSANGNYVILQLSYDTVPGDTNGLDDIGVYTINENPTDVDLSNTTIEENKPIGTVVGTLSTTDSDTSDLHTYSLSCATPGADDGSFNISGADLVSADVFDYETDFSYSICIVSDDGNGGRYEKNFTITINDVTESPADSGDDGPSGPSGPTAIYGCIQNTATNYNPNATADNGSCLYDNDDPIVTPDIPTLPNQDETVVTPKHILGEVKSATEFVQTQVLDEIPTEVTHTVAITGLALPFLFFLTTSQFAIGSIILRFLNLIPTLLGLRRKKRPWGTVFDSMTNQPIGFAYVTLTDITGRGIATAITNTDGRFGFMAAPGNYKLSVMHDNYRFPSQILTGASQDDAYGNLYFNEIIEVKGEEDSIIKNIPMDAVERDETADISGQKSRKSYERRAISIETIIDITFYAGVVSSLVLILTAPTPINQAILGVYVLVLGFRVFRSGRKKQI